MKVLKNPLAAFLICLIVVLASTLLSVNVRLGKRSEAVTDGFYEGVEANGYQQKALATHLKNIVGAVDGIATIADNCDLDASELRAAADTLKNALKYSYGYESYTYQTYAELMSAEGRLVSALNGAALSERDREGLEQYLSTVAGAQSAMESAGYNESVRAFLQRYNGAYTVFIAQAAGVRMPEYFA